MITRLAKESPDMSITVIVIDMKPVGATFNLHLVIGDMTSADRTAPTLEQVQPVEIGRRQSVLPTTSIAAHPVGFEWDALPGHPLVSP